MSDRSVTSPTIVAKVSRVQQLDGLRGVAMLFVFAGHFGSVWKEMPHPSGAADFFLRLVEADATFGSSFFMLLSAFFTYSSMMRGRRPFGEFLVGRLGRIYPLYLIMTAVYVVGCLVFPSVSKLPAGRGEAVTFVIENLLFLPALLHIRPLMDVSWTLSFVILFYFIAAALAKVFRHFALSRLQRFFLLTMAGILWAYAGDGNGWWEPRTAIFWTGMALSEAVGAMGAERLKRAIRLTVPAAVVVLAGVCLRTWLMLDKPDTTPIPFLVLRFMITSATLCAFVWVAYFGPQWWKRLLSGPRLAQLGVASYSFYLTHGVALKVFRYGIFPHLGSALLLDSVFWASQLAGLALAIAIARMVYTFIEQPLAKWCLPFRPPAQGREEKPNVTGAHVAVHDAIQA